MRDLAEKRQHFLEKYDETVADIRRYLAARVDIDQLPDVLQETYCEYYRTLLKKGINYPKDDKQLLYSLAHAQVYRFYKKKEKSKDFQLTYMDEILATDDLDDNISEDKIAAASTLEDQVVDKLLVEQAMAYIATLPPATKQIFYLYYMEDVTLVDIAKEMEVPLHVVKHALYRNLVKIRQHIAGKEKIT